MRASRQTWSRSGGQRRVAIEAQAVRGGTCTLLLLRDADGVRLLFHAAESAGAQLCPEVHSELVEALRQIVE